MTVRNLDAFSSPDSVALIGASHRPGSVGNRIAVNLADGGYGGRLFFVNPKGGSIAGRACHESVAALPLAPDLAVISTPASVVPGIVAELAARGTRGVVVISAGFGEAAGAEAKARRQALLDATGPHLTRIIGPNCVGVLMPRIGLNASFVHLQPKAGEIAFVSQSGAVLAGIIDWAAPRGIGFSQMYSVGDMADVDFGDLLNHLANDRQTSVILMYIEAVTAARKFMSAARAAARAKPVIVMKAGRNREAARAAASHTGAIAGADDVYEAAFRRAGILRVATLNELFGATELLSRTRRLEGEQLAIITNGGGFGVLATDDLVDAGGRLAKLDPATVARLDRLLPAHWSHGNPVDLVGDADGQRYADALAAVLADDNVDAVLVMNCPIGITSSLEAASAVVAAVARGPHKPVLAAWIGDSEEIHRARQRVADAGLPTYATPSEAIGAFMQLVRYRRSQAELMETPPSLPEDFKPDREGAAALIRRRLAGGEGWLADPDAKALIAAYGIPATSPRIATDAAAAVAAAEEIGFPVVVKVLSPDVLHKSDVGGVLLDLADAEAVAAAFRQIEGRLRRMQPEARFTGVTVEPMVRRRHAEELILGMTVDPLFGPVLLFGHGGTAVEVVRDRALALPPLNLSLARRMMQETRIYRLLLGYRDRPAADLDAVALALVKLSQLTVDHPEVVEIDINPLLADPDGVFAVDARVRVAPAPDGADRLAIRPYPQELEGVLTGTNGVDYPMRPIRPEDEPAIRESFRRLSQETVRLRFFSPLKDLSHHMAARLTQIDYDREMAFVVNDPAHRDWIIAVGRLAADPDNRTGEFAIVVGDPVAGQGIGRALMARLIDYAESRGMEEVFGIILRENRRMIDLCERLGFRLESVPGEPELVRAVLPLPRAA